MLATIFCFAIAKFDDEMLAAKINAVTNFGITFVIICKVKFI